MKTITMKKNFLKLAAATLVFFLGVNVVNAQHVGTTVPGTPAVDYADDGVTYMIEGATIPLYALPDNFYHPDYNPGGGVYSLTEGFTWLWSLVAGEGLTFSQNDAQDNYVELTAPAESAGTYTINVRERAPAAWGGCDDGVGTNLTVNVVAAPSVGFGGNQTVEACSGDGSLPSEINANIAGGWQNYRLAWTLQIHTLDNNGLIDLYYDDEDGTNGDGGQKFAVEITIASPQAVAASGDHNIMTVSDFNVINGSPTVYTYTLTSINDQASRFGDFIALDGDDSDLSLFTYYDSGETYTVTVYPAPETGPIYHIPDTWSN